MHFESGSTQHRAQNKKLQENHEAVAKAEV
jgi:hypothetical protein